MHLHAKLFQHSFEITNTRICQAFFCNFIDKITLARYTNFRIIKTVVFVRTALRRRSIFLPKISIFQLFS